LPRIDDLFAGLAGGQKFSKIDLSQAYLQMHVDEKSQELLTIVTHKGLYRYCRLPFGITSAPALFQRAMDQILCGLSGVQCYLDDILVTGRNEEDHLKNLEATLQRLEEYGLRVCKDKCEFFKPSVEYLGHIIDSAGLHKAPAKVKAIVEAPPPRNVSQLRSTELSVQSGCLLWGRRVIIPPPLRSQMLEQLHSGHCGIVHMKEIARSYFWWPRLDSAIEEKAKACMSCQGVRNAPQWAPLHPWDWPENPWQRIHVDFAGPLEGSMFLVAVDAHSKWPEVFIMQSTTAESTIQKLRGLFSRFGLPEQLVSDNGPQFVSQEFQNFMKANGIHHITSAPYHPSTNGLAERFVQTMKNALKSAKGQHSIQKRLDTFLLSYRNTPHATTQASPAFLMMGRQLRTCFD
ncbi:uncharacterized protein K02A2.6-like, partial [Mauremys reevesii]|uniref:uncharacterized protein K02A2.6-like n=1 Tax=Mauremys reevesii TaxID=260615 RepID=UPI00193F3EAA